MKNIMAGKIIGFCDFCFSCRFFCFLLFHDTVTCKTKLHVCRRVDSVVDTPMTGNEAAQHGTVGGIYDSVYGQAGNVAAIGKFPAAPMKDQIMK